MFGDHDQLRILQLAEEISDVVWNYVATWDWFARKTVGDHLVRACDSIGANTAESTGRYHPKDVCVFLYHSRGSLRETQYWLRRAHKRGLLSDDCANWLQEQLTSLLHQLNTYLKFQRQRKTNLTNPTN